MNNSLVPLGPAPAPGPERRRPLSEPQAAALDVLRRRQHPQRVAQIAEELGVHPNTAREHLDALVTAGLALRSRATATGRGRPAWLYAAVDDPEPDVRQRGYAGLAMALAAHLQGGYADPGKEAVDIGRRWGHELAATHQRSGGPRERVLALLTDLGFAPTPAAEPAGNPIALQRCPLLDAAHRYPDVVCRVHDGIVRGALEAFGGEPSQSELTPFAAPGSCRLEIGAETGCRIADHPG